MPSDIEQQISNYYRWIEKRSGMGLRPSTPDTAADQPGQVLIDDLSGFGLPRTSSPTSKRPVVAALAAAAAVIVLIAGVAVASRGDTGNVQLPAAQPESECGLPPVYSQASWDGCVVLGVFMSPDATKADIDSVRIVLESRDGLVDANQLQYLDAQASLERARRTLADEPDAANLLNEDNVVTSFRVASKRSAPVDELRALAQNLAAMPGVYDIQAEGDTGPAVNTDESVTSDEAIVQPGWDEHFDSIDIAADDATTYLDPDGRQLLRLPVGSADGIEIGMPVVNPNGLIGRVETVVDDGSDVLLATNNMFQTGGVLNGTSLEVYVVGNRLTGAGLVGPSDLTSRVEVGDLVMTSGGSEAIAPAGIPIGVVDSISTSPQQASAAHLRMLADPYNDTETLKVLLYQPPANIVGQPPTTAPKPPTTG